MAPMHFINSSRGSASTWGQGLDSGVAVCEWLAGLVSRVCMAGLVFRVCMGVLNISGAQISRDRSVVAPSFSVKFVSEKVVFLGQTWSSLHPLCESGLGHGTHVLFTLSLFCYNLTESASYNISQQVITSLC